MHFDMMTQTDTASLFKLHWHRIADGVLPFGFNIAEYLSILRSLDSGDLLRKEMRQSISCNIQKYQFTWYFLTRFTRVLVRWGEVRTVVPLKRKVLMFGFWIIARVFLNSSVVITSEIVVVYLFFFLASSIELKTVNELLDMR